MDFSARAENRQKEKVMAWREEQIRIAARLCCKLQNKLNTAPLGPEERDRCEMLLAFYKQRLYDLKSNKQRGIGLEEFKRNWHRTRQSEKQRHRIVAMLAAGWIAFVVYQFISALH
jgi:hypothetical protein